MSLSFTVESTDTNDADFYYIVINATLNDAAESFNIDVEITLDVTNCLNEYISPINAISDLTYFIGDSATIQNFDAISLYEANCERVIKYEVFDANLNPVTNSFPFTYDPVTREL